MGHFDYMLTNEPQRSNAVDQYKAGATPASDRSTTMQGIVARRNAGLRTATDFEESVLAARFALTTERVGR